MKHHSKFISHKEIREWLEKYGKKENYGTLISFNIVSVNPSVPKFCKCNFNVNKRFVRTDYVLQEIRKERKESE